MNLADCYRLLRLKSGASFDEIKAAYRRLARQYHPDVNPGDQQAKERFIAVTEAYKFLLAAGEGAGNGQPDQVKRTQNSSADTAPYSSTSRTAGIKITRKSDPIQFNPDLSPVEQQLKVSLYQQLQQLLREQRFPRAIALIEGLARRLPQDPEVVQWQAIVYQRWGRQLIQERQLDKARIYLKKALRTDPHNRSLWAEVEKDFRYMEQLF
jgi:curved DNA-binding protein CbpA